MKIILFLIVLALIFYYIKKSEKDVIKIIKHDTVQRIVLFISAIWVVFAVTIIDPIERVDAWDNVLVLAVLPILLVNGLLIIFRNHEQ